VQRRPSRCFDGWPSRVPPAALALALALGLSTTVTLAQPASKVDDRASPESAGYTVPSTHAWDITSDAGEHYRIFVSYPAAEAPPDGFPVLYVLDGNTVFASFAETRRIQEYYPVGKAIIVGVGYPTDQLYDPRRLNDFTPPLLQPAPAHLRRLAQFKSGGRDAFLDFLTGKLRIEISRRYRIDPQRQSLFGHSLGGLLAMYALYTRPQAFHSIVAASPSLEWNEQGVLLEERDFTARLTGGKVGKTSRLLVVVGRRDVDDDPYLAEALVRRLDRLSGHGLRTRLLWYEEEGHMTVPARAVTDTLRFVFESH
jgi:predicted alpha/beta superfamily hydrolase